MFAPEYQEKCQNIKNLDSLLGLSKCMRFMPHVNDTGGFFIAVFQKINICNDKQSKKSDKELLDMEKKQLNSQKRKRNNYYEDNSPYYYLKNVKNGEIEIKKLIEFYGININFDEYINNKLHVNELMIRCESNPKTIWFVPYLISNIVGNRDNDMLRILHGGTRMFIRHQSTKIEHFCKWRLCQEGILSILPYINKRVLILPKLLYLHLAFNGNLNLETIKILDNGKYIEYYNKLNQLNGGCLIIKLNDMDSDQVIENWQYLSCWKSVKRIELFVKKNDVRLMNMHLKRVFCKDLELLESKYKVNVNKEKQIEKKQKEKNRIKSEKGVKKIDNNSDEKKVKDEDDELQIID